MVEYDEIRITTRREISVCEGAIRKLETFIGLMEKKHGIDSADFLKNFDPVSDASDEELSLWHESCLGLERWKERLSAHRRIMAM